MILLTSQGFYSERTKPILKSMIADKEEGGEIRAALITTASDQREHCPYNIKDRETLLDMGCSQVDFIDLETRANFDSSSYSLIYVCGGNTFRLLQGMRKSSFRESLEKFLDDGGIYVGVSAGSLVLGPSIELADWFTDENNVVGLSDFTGLNTVPVTVFPHYSDQAEAQIVDFERTHSVKVTRLTDSQVLVCKREDDRFLCEAF